MTTSLTHTDLDALIVPGATLTFKGSGSVGGTLHPAFASWEEFCEKHGFTYAERVTKSKLDALITDTPDSTVGKEAQAREWGKPIIPMDVFAEWFNSRGTQPSTPKPTAQQPEPVVDPTPAPTPDLPANPYIGTEVQTTPKPEAKAPQPTAPTPQPTKRPGLAVWFVLAGIMLFLSLATFVPGIQQGLNDNLDMGGPLIALAFVCLGSGVTLLAAGVVQFLRRHMAQ